MLRTFEELGGSFSRDEQNHVSEFSSENQRFSAHLLRRHFLTQAAGQVDSGAWLGQQYTGLVFASLDKFYLIARLQDALVSSIIVLHEHVSPSPYPFCFLYPKRDITCHNQCRFSRKGPIPRAIPEPHFGDLGPVGFVNSHRIQQPQ